MILMKVASMTDPVDVDAARARANAATPGPWTAITSGRANGDHWYVCDDSQGLAMISSDDGINEDQREPDAVFIAAARSDVPALADEVDRLRAENEQLQELNGQQARHIEELRKPVQEHCRRWHIPAITERDAALAEVTRLTAIIESAENLCARRCFPAALGGGS
jgi:hypothetical protein